jgi:eukaryotic-like serine/threonine-protein kinase
MVGTFGEVLVLDWGLAKVLVDGELGAVRGTGESAVLGTAGFMSPEQQAGGSAGVDARSDVYSLGALLQWMGARDVPAALRAIVAKATAPEREHRYPDVLSLAEDVSHFIDGAAVSAHRETLFDRGLRLVRRHRIAIGIVVAYLSGRALIFLATGR